MFKLMLLKKFVFSKKIIRNIILILYVTTTNALVSLIVCTGTLRGKGMRLQIKPKTLFTDPDPASGAHSDPAPELNRTEYVRILIRLKFSTFLKIRAFTLVKMLVIGLKGTVSPDWICLIEQCMDRSRLGHPSLKIRKNSKIF